MKTPHAKHLDRRVHRYVLPGRQRGISLFVAITALALMTVAGLSLMRSVDTANQIAGNMAYRSAGLNASDLGVEAAAAFLHNVVWAAPDAQIPAGCRVGAVARSGPPPVAAQNGNCRYSPRILPADEQGLPPVDWANEGNIPVTTVDGNRIQFVIERLCNPNDTLVINLGSSPGYDEDNLPLCMWRDVPVPPKNKAGVLLGVSDRVGIMYRVTVRVRGPRNTTTFVQAVLER